MAGTAALIHPGEILLTEEMPPPVAVGSLRPGKGLCGNAARNCPENALSEWMSDS